VVWWGVGGVGGVSSEACPAVGPAERARVNRDGKRTGEPDNTGGEG